jgi:uncharacterized protein YkwD
VNWKRLIAVAAVAATSACSGAATDAPPTEVPESTRRAATLAAFPTAASLTTPTAAPTEAAAATAEPTVAPTETPSPAQEYEVQKGDTLSTIAARFKVSVAAIQLANQRGESQDVRLGEKLKIPSTRIADDESTYWFVYVVKSGDTLSTIAARFKVEVADVLRVNGIADASRVLVDQALVIPVKAPRTSDAAPAAAKVQARVQSAPSLIPLVTAAPEAPTAEPTAALIALAPAPVADAPPTAAPVVAVAAVAADDVEAMRAALLALHNEQRAAAGLPALRYSMVLQTSAQLHAEDCATRGYGSHVGSDGSSAHQRIARAGYPGTATGENWAFARSAAAAFNMWFHQESPSGPHRRNIMSASYSEVGFGITRMGGGYIFIANLGG